MKDTLKTIVVAAAPALLVLTAAAGPAAAQDDTIRIGITLRMLVENGIKYGNMSKDLLEAVNDTGGINGHKVEVILLDDECKPDKGVANVNRFIHQSKVHLIMGSTCSSVTLPIADITAYRPADGPRLGVVATDLVSALFAHVLETDSRLLPPENHRRTLVRRIRAFIQRHLDDPHLTPRAIAEAHHISLSYLHRLFQDEDVTVAALIRRERMERARRDLTDSALHTAPVALASLSREHVQDSELMMAGSVVTIAPVLVLFLGLQRYYMQGLLVGSVK